jgi:hypothetical protein
MDVKGGAALDTCTPMHNNTIMNAQLKPVAALITTATAPGASG